MLLVCWSNQVGQSMVCVSFVDVLWRAMALGKRNRFNAVVFVRTSERASFAFMAVSRTFCAFSELDISLRVWLARVVGNCTVSSAIVAVAFRTRIMLG